MPHSIISDTCEGVALCAESCPVNCIKKSNGKNIKGSDYSLFENDIPILRDFQKDLIKKLSDYFDSEICITESFFNIIKPRPKEEEELGMSRVRREDGEKK